MKIIPKKQFVDATRELLSVSKEQTEVSACGLSITTDPEVFNPGVFFSSQWFADEVAKMVKGEKIFIEVGCGTGIVSIKVAKENPGLEVYATDINPKAAEMTLFNASKNGVENRIHTSFGDVLDPINEGVRADSIFWAMPFGYIEPEEGLNGRDWQVFDPGYRAIKKFFVTAKNYLTENGRLLVGFSVDIGHFDLLEDIVKENGFTITLLTKTSGVEKDSVSMEIYEAKRG